MTRVVFIILILVSAAPGYRNGSSRIIGGRNVAYGELPYQAALQYWDTGFYFASAVLLNTRWVLTTAKGVVGRAHTSVNIVLGTNRIDVPVTNRISNEIRIHPLYDQATQANDIAVVRSSTVIVFTVTITPITLSTNFVIDGVTAHVSGWGAVHENKTGESSMLQLVYVTTSPCVNTEFITYNTANHFCAGSPANNTGPLIGICTTDVGGPLVLNNLLIGIPFHHDPRACGRFLDGYMRITSYRAWILGNIPV